ncbi:MAG: PQQ-dependent sugar dehydrogenase [Cytophagaceae bacterium]
MRSVLYLHLIFIVVVVIQSCNQVASENNTTSLVFKAVPIAKNVIAPVGFTFSPDQTGRLFYIEQQGRVMVIKEGKVLEKPFIDIRSKVIRQSNSYSERGLLGMAFHPKFKHNGKFYLYYSAESTDKNYDHISVISEFKVPDASALEAMTEEKIVLTIPQPKSNHNGGHLMFGKDGCLYIGVGDGGGAGDPFGEFGNAQDRGNLLGKILRIDVDNGSPYSIPDDNPFTKGNNRPEIWAYGLRNPWRFSEDRQTGAMYCGDVGQNEFEETNIIVKGGNYGWRKYEGFQVFDKSLPLDEEKVIMPIDVYGRQEGVSICGGFVYRGDKYPLLQGKYIFGDWSGKLYYLEKSPDGETWRRNQILLPELNDDITLNSLGEDESGEIYILIQESIGPEMPNGSIYRLAIQPA